MSLCWLISGCCPKPVVRVKRSILPQTIKGKVCFSKEQARKIITGQEKQKHRIRKLQILLKFAKKKCKLDLSALAKKDQAELEELSKCPACRSFLWGSLGVAGGLVLGVTSGILVGLFLLK